MKEVDEINVVNENKIANENKVENDIQNSNFGIDVNQPIKIFEETKEDIKFLQYRVSLLSIQLLLNNLQFLRMPQNSNSRIH